MRAAIGRKVDGRRESETNVKEGRGTIREIEFTVQLLQLLFGAQRPAIRSGNSLDALARLEAAGLLTPEERELFGDHYRFFRVVEHRLQIVDDLPVRLLPDDPFAIIQPPRISHGRESGGGELEGTKQEHGKKRSNRDLACQARRSGSGHFDGSGACHPRLGRARTSICLPKGFSGDFK